MTENYEVEPRVTCFKCEAEPYVVSKCEAGPCVVTRFKLRSGTMWYLLWSGKWDCVLLSSKTTTLKLGHEKFWRKWCTRAFQNLCNLCNRVEYRQVSFYTRETFLKNAAQSNTKFPLAQCISWRLEEWQPPPIQGVTGGTDQTSGECSLGHTIPI